MAKMTTINLNPSTSFSDFMKSARAAGTSVLRAKHNRTRRGVAEFWQIQVSGPLPDLYRLGTVAN